MNDRERQIKRAMEAPCIVCGTDSPFGEHQCLAAGAFARMEGLRAHEVIDRLAKAQRSMGQSAKRAADAIRGLNPTAFVMDDMGNYQDLGATEIQIGVDPGKPDDMIAFSYVSPSDFKTGVNSRFTVITGLT